jgi:hypothetical protein
VVIDVIEHRLVRTNSYARETPHTEVHPDANVIAFIPKDSLGGTHGDAFATMIAKDSVGKLPFIVIDANSRFFCIGFFKECL